MSDEQLRGPEASEVVPGIRNFVQVTERPLEQVVFLIDRQNERESSEAAIDRILATLPINARVADMGSGTYQGMARAIKAKRPDIEVLSLDPTLLVDSDRISSREIVVCRNTDPEGRVVKDRVTYVTRDFLDSDMEGYEISNPLAMFANTKNSLLKTFGVPLSAEDGLRVHEGRLRSAAEQGGLPFVYPNVPEQVAGIDWLVECHGPLYYTDVDNPNRYAYLKEIIQALKVGGKADIFPWQSESLYMDQDMVIEGRREFEEEFRRQLGAVFANIEISYTTSTLGMARPGLHITKI